MFRSQLGLGQHPFYSWLPFWITMSFIFMAAFSGSQHPLYVLLSGLHTLLPFRTTTPFVCTTALLDYIYCCLSGSQHSLYALLSFLDHNTLYINCCLSGLQHPVYTPLSFLDHNILYIFYSLFSITTSFIYSTVFSGSQHLVYVLLPFWITYIVAFLDHNTLYMLFYLPAWILPCQVSRLGSWAAFWNLHYLVAGFSEASALCPSPSPDFLHPVFFLGPLQSTFLSSGLWINKRITPKDYDRSS